MTPEDKPSQREFIDYRFTEVFKRLDRMERTMNNFAFAKQTEVDEIKKDLVAIKDDVQKNYVSKEDLAWIKYIATGVAVGVGVAIVVAILRLIGSRL